MYKLQSTYIRSQTVAHSQLHTWKKHTSTVTATPATPTTIIKSTRKILMNESSVFMNEFEMPKMLTFYIVWSVVIQATIEIMWMAKFAQQQNETYKMCNERMMRCALNVAHSNAH